MGKPVSLASHQIPMGRIYRYDAGSKLLQPASDWISMAT